jgi:predicted metal-binding protein
VGSASKATVLVCVTCRLPGEALDGPCAGATLAEAASVAAQGAPDVCVQRIRCLGNCNRGLSAAIRHDSTWTYVFGHLDPFSDAVALIAGARLLAAAHDGLLPWRGRPESLKRGLIARVPPLNFGGEPT